MCRSGGSIARRHPRPPHPTGLLRPCHCARPPSTHGQPESGLADATGLPDVAITIRYFDGDGEYHAYYFRPFPHDARLHSHEAH